MGRDETRRDETRRDERFVSVRRACLCVFGNGEPPRRELVDDGGGRLAHECRWHARQEPRQRCSRPRTMEEAVALLNEIARSQHGVGTHL